MGGHQAGAAAFAAEMAAQAGKLSLEVVDVAGVVDDVSSRITRQNEEFLHLKGAAGDMLASNRTITAAAAETEQISGKARQDMAQSRQTLDKTVEEMGFMADLVEGIGTAAERLGQALSRVSNVASSIASIARQTNLLALNATIEAARAGEAGKGFAVVAAEVKELSRATSIATQEIQSTVQELGSSVSFVLDRARICVNQAAQVREQTIDVAERVAEVDHAMDGITRGAKGIVGSAMAIDGLCQDFVQVISAAVDGVGDSNRQLNEAHGRVLRLVEFAEDLISGTVAAGIETEDSLYISIVQEGAAAIAREFEKALADRRISLADLFDDDYRPIAGSNPQQFTTRYLDLTDRILPDIQEPPLARDARIVFCAAVDRNGYLPTHNRKFSQPQGNDPVWNAANCRNRRMFNDRVGLAAGRNEKPILLQSYRRDMGGGSFMLMKDVSAPILVAGRHWGGLRLGYKA